MLYKTMSCLMRYTLGVFHQDHDQDHAVLDVCLSQIIMARHIQVVLICTLLKSLNVGTIPISN